MSRREILETRGSGFNFKLGAIARVNDWLRLGAAFHTPTYYSNMEDKWRYRMTSELVFDNQTETRSAESPRGRFEYELTTPMKAIGSATVLFGKSGLVSAEYEFTDHSNAKLNSSSDKFIDENKDIRDSYTAAHNIRLGTEWRLDEVYFRGGYAIFGSPYKSGINDGKGNQFSLGMGFRQQDYYIDFAYVNSTLKENRFMYPVPTDEGLDFFAPVANQQFNRQLFMLTLGWRF
jgi:long-subunit fatty acid transport protein